MDEWHIGDPVDWGDGWMDAQNWGHGCDDEEEKDYFPNKTTPDSKGKRNSRRSYNRHRYLSDEKALEKINRALEVDKNNAHFWNKKASILESLKRY